MQDIRASIGMWQDQVDEKKKQLDEAKEALKIKDTKIAYLNEQMRLLAESNKSYIESKRTQDEKNKKETLKLQVMLRAREKEVMESKEQGRLTAKKLEDENRKTKASSLELIQSVQEYSKRNGELEKHMRVLEAENADFKAKVGDASGKENLWYTQAAKWKTEVDRLKHDVLRLDAEKERLNMENNMLTGHTNANQKIHLHQKIKDENNTLRTQNFKLSEEMKVLKERSVRVEKDFQYLQAKFKAGPSDLLSLPSKYELQIQQLEERLQKELAISVELSKLPEIAPIYAEQLEGAEPIEQIARTMDYLIQILRVQKRVAKCE